MVHHSGKSLEFMTQTMGAMQLLSALGRCLQELHNLVD